MSEYTTWDEKTISFIQQQRDVLKDVSSRIGISAEALAGTMAKENNGYQTGTACEQAKDLWATGGGLYDHDWWAAEYALIKDLDLTDSASGTTGTIAKVFFPGLIDLGPFNLQTATAIRELYEYVDANPSSDPLNLKQYADDLQKFAVTISGLSIGGYEANSEETVRVSAAIWGMRIKDAQEWFENKVNQDQQSMDYWNGLKQETRDALCSIWSVVHSGAKENGGVVY